MPTNAYNKDYSNPDRTHSAAHGALYALSDSLSIQPATRAFMVSTSGTLRVRMGYNQTVLDLPVIAGVLYPLTVDMFYSTGTSGPSSALAFW